MHKGLFQSLGQSLAAALVASALVTSPFMASSASAASAGSGDCVQDYTVSSGNGALAVSSSGGFCYVAFKNLGAVGTDAVINWSRPANVTHVDLLVVGGGGGGGSRHQGGGGAGRFVEATQYNITAGSTMTVTVGGGGAGSDGSTLTGTKGQASSFLLSGQGITAPGGGGGSTGTGGSSGGTGTATPNSPESGTLNTLLGTQAFGNNLGNLGARGSDESNQGADSTVDYWAGGGGGGAGSAGGRPTVNGVPLAGANDFPDNTTPSAARGGAGGAGQSLPWVPSSIASELGVGEISGSNVFFAGGGGGGIGNDGASGGDGGVGGGGDGTKYTQIAGDAANHTGGGGGASGYDDLSPDPVTFQNGASNPPGGNGGSGLIILRYAPVGSVDQALSLTSYRQATGSSIIPRQTSDSFSMEAWVYPTDLAGWKILLNQTTTIPDGFERTFIGALDGKIHFGVNGGSFIDTNVSLRANRWQHLALTATGSTIKVFLDGVEVHSTTGYSRVGTAGPAFHLGGSHVSNEYWVGSIDQVKVWASALSQVEIEKSMNTYSSSGIAQPLYAHYDFNAVTTGIELDESGNGRHLTLGSSVTAAQFSTSPIVVSGASTASERYIQFNRTYLTALGGWTPPTEVTAVDLLVVGGGGGGGSRHAGGGGAGGLVTGSAVLSAQAYSVQVGQGGRGAPEHSNVALSATVSPKSGGTSSAFALTARGGGNGASSNVSAGVGGSGGGGNGGSSAAVGTPAQGNAGGDGRGGGNWAGGGGGGAGTAGSPVTENSVGANGGLGLVTNITGTPMTLAAGGGGAGHLGSGLGGSGVGGDGGFGTISATAKGSDGETFGSGGGAGNYNDVNLNFAAGSGYQGVVILSYSLAPNAPTSLTATQSTSHATINLSWTPPTYTGNSSITDYDIEYKPAGGSWTSYSDGVSTATNRAVVLPQQCIAHEFRVIAKNSNFSSAASATASATPVWGTFGSLTGVQISSTNSECVVKFTSTTSSTWTPPTGTTAVEALLVGGGGGGGAWVGGGGGGGGVTESRVVLTPNSAVTVDVGAGGVGASKIGLNTASIAGIGEPTVFGSATAYGGGAGMTWDSTEATGNFATSGGASGRVGKKVALTPTVMGQGFKGGDVPGEPNVSTAQPHGTGGGGGAGGAGQDAISNAQSGNGGAGFASDITGDSIRYGGGGGGSIHGVTSTGGTDGTAGLGQDGGGNGDGPKRISWTGDTTGVSTADTTGQNGFDGLGGGGGGAAAQSTTNNSYGGRGGSGLVVIRQLSVEAPSIITQPLSASVTPGETKTLTVTATGNGNLSYQWQSSTDGTNWTNVGTNSPSFTTPTLNLADDGIRYRVGVTNTLNGQTSTVTSSVAVITVAGVTITSGTCTAMVGNDSGVTISETANGGCLVEYTTPGSNTFFVPNLVSSLQAFIVGGGGGGGGAKLGQGGGGGGGGAASRVVNLSVTGSQVVPVTVGAGGSGGAANADGQNGGATSVSSSFVVAGGSGGKTPPGWPSGGGQGGSGGSTSLASSGGSGGAGATDPADRSYYQPRFGNAGSSRTFAGEYWCVGGGAGGGNREVSNDVYFQWEPRSQFCSDGTSKPGGSGGWHNGTTNVLPTSGEANRGGGGGGGSYNSSLNVVRAGASGANGLVAIYFTPSTGEISLSSVAPFSFSATTKTITLTKDNPTTNVTWTTSNTAVCTVTGTSTTGTVTPVAAGLCEVSVVVAASSPYARGMAATSFQIDKISRTAPSWINNSVSVPFGSTIDLRPRLLSPGSDIFTFLTSGTAGSCSVTGYTVTVGNVGDTCDVTPTLVGDSRYLDMVGSTPLSVTVTKISQSALVLTSATSMNVNQTLTLSAAGGSGTGILSYFVANQNGTGCVANQSTGALTATAAGNCEVYAQRAGSTNYDPVTSSNVVVTINKVAQNLSWVSQPQAQYLAGQTYALDATASSQLSVAYSIGSGLCSLAGTTVTFTGSGDCVIQASQAGNAAYLAAVTISQTVSVGKINQTMTFSALANKSWGSLAFSLSATASSGLNITYTENNQTTNDACDVSANGIVTIKNVGTCAVTATQAGDVAYTSVTTTRLFEVTANQAGAPFIGSVSFGDRQLNASFFTPSYLGGGTVSAYQLLAYNLDGTVAATNSGCVANAGATQSCSVIGLDNGRKYVLKVAAITQAGLGEFSASSSEIIPAANPEAVGNLIAIEGNGTLTLQWTEPTSFGGGNFFQYRIYWRAPGQQYQADGSPGATVGTQASTSYVITGLTNGVAYDVKIVTATSNNNVELQSNTAEVRQTPYTVPDAPAAVVALDNDNNVVVAWQPPVFDGGNPIDQYVVKKGNSTVCTITSATTTSCEIARPAPGTTEVIEVRAGNDAGLSDPVSTSITVAALSGSNPPGLIVGGGFPGVTPGAVAPIVLDVSGSAVVKTNEVVRLIGTNFNLVEKVLVGDVEASFFVNSAELLTIRIPVDVAAGKPTITLQGAFGSRIFTNLIEVSITQVALDTKVTIGTFLGFAAVYTKNHEGKRLSMKIGSKWRVIESLGSDYTYNFTKVGAGKTVTVMVYLDRQLVQVKQIKIQ